MTTPSPKTRPGLPRRLLRASARAFALLLSALALLVALAWSLLQVPGVRAHLLARALEAVCGAIPGRIEVNEWGGEPPFDLVFRGVRVLDPTGREALRLERLEIALDVGSLLRGQVHVARLALIGPSLTLLDEAGRLPLGAAFSAAGESAPPEIGPAATGPGPLSPVPVRVAEVILRGGGLRLEPGPGGPALHDLELRGQVELDRDVRWRVTTLRATAEGLPVPDLDLALAGAWGAREGLRVDDLRLGAGAHDLRAWGSLGAEGAVELVLAHLRLDLPAFGLPLPGALRGAGHLSGSLDDLQVALDASLGATALRVDARAWPAAPGVWLRARFSGLDTDALGPAAEVAPGLRLDGDAWAWVDGDPRASGSAFLDIDLAHLRAAHGPLGDLSLSLGLVRGEVQGEVSLRGADEARVDLSGRVGANLPSLADASLQIEHLDVGPWARVLGVPGVSGVVRDLHLETSGAISEEGASGLRGRASFTLESASLRRADLPTLALGRLHADARGTWGGCGLPSARLSLDAGALALGPNTVERLRLDARMARQGASTRVFLEGDLAGARAGPDVAAGNASWRGSARLAGASAREIALTVDATDLRVPGAACARTRVDWKGDWDAGRLTLRGPLQLFEARAAGDLRLAQAGADLDLALDPLAGRAEGAVIVTLRDLGVGVQASLAGLRAHVGLKRRPGRAWAHTATGRVEIADLRVGAGSGAPDALTLPELRGLFSLDMDAATLPSGALRLSAPAAQVSGWKVRDLALKIERDARGATRLDASTAAGDLRLATSLGLTWPPPRAGSLDATLARLSFDLKGDGLRATTPATLTLGPEGSVRLEDLALEGLGALASARVAARADYEPRQQRLRAGAMVAGVDLAAWANLGRRLGLKLPSPLAGNLDLGLEVSGTPAAPTGHLSLHLRGARLPHLEDTSLQADARLEEDSLTGTLKATWAPSARVAAAWRLPGAVRLEPGGLRLRLPGDAPFEIKLDATNLDLAPLGRLLDIPGLAGVVTCAGQVGGTLDAPTSVLGMRVKGLAAPDWEAADVDAALVLAAESTQARFQVARGGVIPFRAELDLPLNVVSVLRGAEEQSAALARLAQAPFSLSLQVKETRLAALPFVGPRMGEIGDARVAARVAVGGRLDAPHADGTLSLTGLRWRGLDLAADLRLAARERGLIATAEAREGEAVIASSELELPDLPALLEPGGLTRLALQPGLRASVDVQDLPLLRLAELQPSAGEWLTRLLGTGSVAASLSLVGGERGPTLVARAIGRSTLPRGGVLPPFAREVLVDATLLDEDLRVVVGVGQESAGNALQIDAATRVPWRGLLPGGEAVDWATLPARARLRSRGFDLAGLSVFLPDLFGASRGGVEADLALTGTLGDPRAEGHAELRFDELVVSAAGLAQEDVRVRLEVTPEQIRLVPLTLTTGEGTCALALTIATPTWRARDVALNGALTLDRCRALAREDLDATLSGNATLGGSLAEPVLVGDVRVDRARVSPAMDGRSLREIGPPADVVFVTAEGLDLPNPDERRVRFAGSRARVQLALHLPPRSLHVENRLLDVWPTGDLLVRITDGVPDVEGRIGVTAGNVEFYGKRFALAEDSLVVFPGGARLSPRLTVSARYDISRVDLRALGLDAEPDSHILLTVSGSAEKPELTLSSDPPMDQTAIISIMLVGSPVGAGQSRREEAGVQRQTLNLVVGLATGQVARLLASDLPVDVFRVEAGDRGLAGARITVGKRLTRDLTVVYAADLGAEEGENENEVRVQYRLTRLLQVETYVGDAGQGGVDLLLRWRF